MTEDLKSLPVVKEVQGGIEEFLKKAGIPTIETAQDVERAKSIRAAIKGHLKLVEDRLGPLRQAAYTSYKGWMELIKEATVGLKELDAIIVAKVREWQKVEEQRRAEAKRKADEELARAAELEAKGDAEGANKTLETAVATETEAEAPGPKLDKRTFRDKWRAEVVDLKALCHAVAIGKVPVELVQPNMSALNKLAREMKLDMFKRIPGVKAVCE